MTRLHIALTVLALVLLLVWCAAAILSQTPKWGRAVSAAVFTINSPWPFVAVLACAVAAVLFAFYVEGRGQ